MNSKYQLILLGNSRPHRAIIVSRLSDRLNELGVSESSLELIDSSNFNSLYKGNSPTVCVYFGELILRSADLKILDQLIFDSTLIIPTVDDLKNFIDEMPAQLHPVNGFLLTGDTIEALIARILEGFRLLRVSRRLFISYKRSESTGVAIQLYERLEQAGFDVFLDTHSIRQGEDFQAELWHRMVDTDVVVLLNTKGFLNSEWTAKELAKASAMSIGILQLVWPDHNSEKSSQLTKQIQLKKSDFDQTNISGKKTSLRLEILDRIIESVESIRARSLGARQDNIISEFISTARDHGIFANLQSEKIITFNDENGRLIVVIPTIGVPEARTYNESDDLVMAIKEHQVSQVLLLYDHINIREKWLQHLAWLDKYLPVSTLKILETDDWFENLSI